MAPPWADTPFPMSPTPRTTHPTLKPGVLHIANEMAVCHNALIRIMNSIYNQAPYIELEEDKADFLEYNRRWINWVRVHHHGEETFFFPAIGKATGQPDIMETNVEQHHTFEPLFSQYVDYVEACVLARTYDAVELRRLIDALAPPFTQHLEEEVVTLLELNKFDDEPLRKALEDWEVVLQNLPGAKFGTFPIVCGSHDNTFEGGYRWPQIPWFVNTLVHYVFERKYQGAWRFNPSDAWGTPRPLLFGPPKDEAKQ